jgi:hypothetical protein
MTSRDRTLLSIDRGRKSVARRPVLRPYSVTVRLEQYSGAIAQGVTTMPPVSSLLITPAPKVEQLDDADASFYGGGNIISDSTGAMKMSVFRVSEITPAYNTGVFSGGYTERQLLPVIANPSQRAVWLIVGPGLLPGGEPFEVVDPKFSDPFGWSFVARRVAIFTSPYP